MGDKTKWLLTLASGIAGVITLGNFVYGFLVEIKALTGLNVMGITSPFRFIAFIILESFLAYGLGWCIAYLSQKGDGLPETWVLVTALVSSWTSLFNVQWMLLGPTPDELTFAYWFKFLLLTICAVLISVQFIQYHCKNGGKDDAVETLSLLQIACFVGMYFTFLFWL